MKLGEWISSATLRLSEAGIESARFEAQMLAAKSLGWSRSKVLAETHHEIQPQAMNELLERRLRREPLAYILGEREFFGRSFAVQPGVLIPRPETEHLIEVCLQKFGPEPRRVLEIGVGSGCVAITLALERTEWSVVGWDISEAALLVASRNAGSLKANVDFELRDALQPYSGPRFDLVISNPPYVEEEADLQPEVRQFEPAEALFAGVDGLDFYRRFAPILPQILAPGGCAAFEFGKGQGARIQQLYPEFRSTLFRDLSGLDRILLLEP